MPKHGTLDNIVSEILENETWKTFERTLKKKLKRKKIANVELATLF